MIKVITGMNIPVDGIIVSGLGIQADESAMTGESLPLTKECVAKCQQRQQEFENDNPDMKEDERTPHDVPSPVLLSGTQVQTGEGWFVCVVVGDMTCEGQILAGLVDSGGETTPLQDKLEVIAQDIGKLGMLAALLIFHALLFRQFIEAMMTRRWSLQGVKGEDVKYFYYHAEWNPTGMFGGNPNFTDLKDVAVARCHETIENPDMWGKECIANMDDYISDWLGYVMVGIAIVVVAVPEGLPLAVMISLAYSVRRMLDDNNFVKRLTSCEIMGGANNM